MTHYVALLRGINVGGITITMADLADTVRSLGHTGVKTVLASGNLVFDSDETDAATLKSGLERLLSDTFGYEAWVVLLTRDALAAAVEDYPFDDLDGWHSYVLFGSDPAMLDELLTAAPTLDPADDRVVPGDGVVYWQVRREVGIKSPFSSLSAKTRYKASTTNRNLRTLRKILDLPG
ncbi:DUF1697 domain-containing protein [Cryobacterium sp. 1639]|uniref:DUF1697 domain-containing protein n=1 Tax=Cryobacterium inferilacus TaxID=2866629 RepID=UPI001C73CA42|nr:DUF1697 domain-containing protein [Cryobacterium sp. 1639]MBX0298480.1 DUF1697 domain-containing protein [Cryobacterium sp. 1639]